MRADLHLHTVYSDGAYSPEEIARRVKEAGVSLFAVTDHDNMEGAARAREAAEREGLLFVQAMEISAYESFGKLHVLGYCCRANGAYSRFLRERVEGACLRADDSRRKANAYFGCNVTMEEIVAQQKEKGVPLHTMHVVSAFCAKLGLPLFDTYEKVFAHGKAACSPLSRPTGREAIETIHAMGGKAVVAHPHKISLTKTEKTGLIRTLEKNGLDGIECFHPSHTERESADYAAYARQKGLLITGGSDFHADGTVRRIGLPAFTPSEALLKALSL